MRFLSYLNEEVEIETDKDGNKTILSNKGGKLTRQAKTADENHRHYLKGHTDGIMAHIVGHTIHPDRAKHEAPHDAKVREKQKYMKGWMDGANHSADRKSQGKKPIFLEKNFDLD